MNRPINALFLAPVEPWSRESGSSLIIADLLEELQRHEGATVRARFARRSPVAYGAGPPPSGSAVTLGIDLMPRAESILRAMLLMRSPMRLRFSTERLIDGIIGSLGDSSTSLDVIHVEHLPLLDAGLALGKSLRVPVVFRSHNVEAVLLRRRLAVRGKVADTVERVALRSEIAVVSQCASVLCISEEDAEAYRRCSPSTAIEYFPCALSMDRYAPFLDTPVDSSPTIAFVGGLDWAPNARGLRWFIENVMPLVLSRYPEVKLRVLARGASETAWLRGGSGVELVAHSQDPRRLFATSWLSVAPLLDGGGVRIKIPESLSVGCPVVATRIGGEGHALPGLEMSDDPVALAELCVRIIQRGPRGTWRHGLHAAVSEVHGAKKQADRLVQIWRRIASASGNRGPWLGGDAT